MAVNSTIVSIDLEFSFHCLFLFDGDHELLIIGFVDESRVDPACCRYDMFLRRPPS